MEKLGTSKTPEPIKRRYYLYDNNMQLIYTSDVCNSFSEMETHFENKNGYKWQDKHENCIWKLNWESE